MAFIPRRFLQNLGVQPWIGLLQFNIYHPSAGPTPNQDLQLLLVLFSSQISLATAWPRGGHVKPFDRGNICQKTYDALRRFILVLPPSIPSAAFDGSSQQSTFRCRSPPLLHHNFYPIRSFFNPCDDFSVMVHPNNVLKVNSRPLTPWELSTLLKPMHAYRCSKLKRAKDRAHFPAILSFVYRNRFAVASQIQRRFPQHLRSDRSARRHLAEMQQLGYLDLAPTRSTSPLWPKVYFVTGRGVKKLQRALARQGKEWQPIVVDRRGRHSQEGYSSDHVLHEICTTEFLLAAWQTVQQRPDLDLLTIQRRSLAKHSAFRISVNRKKSRLQPDALFVFRQNNAGMIAVLLEMDTGEMNRNNMKTKLRRYQAWTQSESGQDYLTDLYERFGVKNPKPNFRVLFICEDRSNSGGKARLTELLALAWELPRDLRDRMWFTTVALLRERQHDQQPLGSSIFYRAKDVATRSEQFKKHTATAAHSDIRTKGVRSLLEQHLSKMPLHPLFPFPLQSPDDQ